MRLSSIIKRMKFTPLSANKKAASPFGMERTCRSCSNKFVLTSIEVSFYAAEKMLSPHVCRSCQRKVHPDAFTSSRYANVS